jgi:FkbM family methyltransferase
MIDRILKKVRRTYRNLTKKPYGEDPRFPAYWFERVRGGRETFVVQIGSNDGKTNDPLYELFAKYPAWSALLVEPIPYISERLRGNYPDANRFAIANVAINGGEDLPFYHVDPQAKKEHPDLPAWFDQLASFDRNHLTNHLDGILEPYVRTLEVKGTTLPNLLQDNAVEKIDLIHIDTEGYDWKVLQQLDLSRYTPDFILFERHHLSPEAISEALAFLSPAYEVFSTDIDALAVNRKLENDVRSGIAKHMTRLGA